jgi:ATP-dependent DNA helicase RecG
MESPLYKKLKTIQDAINYEIDQHYINAKGKKTTFSDFVVKNTKELSIEIEDRERLKSLIGLFYSYPSQDISSRINVIHKAQEILRLISEEYKKLLTVEEPKPIVDTPRRGASTAGKSFEKDIKKIDVKYVKGVGPKLSMTLNKLGVFNVNDLFHYFPRAYIDYQKQLPIRDLKIDEEVTVSGVIKGIRSFNPPKRKDLTIFTIVIQDATGKISITKFLAGKFGRIMKEQYKKQYSIGAKVVCSGKVSFDKFSRSVCLDGATIEVLGGENEEGSLNVGRIVSVYPLTEGLSVEFLRKIMANAFNVYSENIIETLPQKILKEEKLVDLKTSLNQIHFPTSSQLCDLARGRLVFEEFFLMQLRLGYRRYHVEKGKKGLAIKNPKEQLVKKLLSSLPFKLTNAQKKAYEEIKNDLMSEDPMHRLLQGDVGSGKTIVALLALLLAIENGYQTALMAPTEILSFQHAKRFQEYLNPLGISVGVLTGSTPAKQRKEIHSQLESGQLKIIVGTHALIQDDVKFENLGLVIIDEQHRFGVKQRDDLLKKGKNVERLFMTATPIPRTLALAMHGDLELSEIDEMPAGRMPIKTSIVQPWQRAKAFDLIKGEVAKGRQVYIVFPLIEESEKLTAKAATIEYEELSKNILKDLRIGLMHGELKSDEKDRVMNAFKDGKLDVLVSTTVIEVGVDVQNATVMMIENAERFGLSQLHQLRGRVGRDSNQAYCLLVPQNYSEDVITRLSILTKTNNGFIISQEDLKIRGPGDFLGTKQSGLPDLHLSDLLRDSQTLEVAREKAIQIIKEDPELEDYPELKKIISENKNDYISAG